MHDSKMIANTKRLHEFMSSREVDSLVLRSGVNVTYLSGFAYPGTLGRHLDFVDSPRNILLLWPREGEPVLIADLFAVPLAKRDGLISDIRSFNGYVESAYSVLHTVLHEKGLADGRLGFEYNCLNEETLGSVRNYFPRADLFDCSDMMDQVRWIKTKEEVALLEENADVLDKAYLDVFPDVKAGDTEREIHARIVKACISRGAQWAHGILNSSRNTVMYGGEGDFEFAVSDIIRNDYVLYRNGYPGHQSRTVVLGTPSIDQIKMYETVRDIYRATIEQCRPGIPAKAVHEFAVHHFKQAGFKNKVNITGHGVGAWWHQQRPFLVEGSDDIIEDGMVIAFEPHVGYWHIQDMVLITDKGSSLLSRTWNTDTMLVIGNT